MYLAMSVGSAFCVLGSVVDRAFLLWWNLRGTLGLFEVYLLHTVVMLVVGSTAPPFALPTGRAFGLPIGAGLDGVPGGPGNF